MSEINILQLSDLHLNSNKTNDPQVVLDALWQDLDNFDKIDFIVFTGDLVQGGDSKESFDEAYRIFIEPLLEKTGVPKENFFLVPGNHEVELQSVDEIVEVGLKHMLIDRDSVNKVIDGEIKNGFKHIERFDHYYAFKTKVIGSGHTVNINKLYSTHKVEKNNTTIGIACLNSAWRAAGKGSDHDIGKLIIGERQIREALKEIKGCDIKIALNHHPISWLTEDDQIQAQKILFKEFDFLFCGHLHAANLQAIQAFKERVVVVQGGSLFKGLDHHNGYSVLTLEPSKAEATLKLRTYFDERYEFAEAVNRCKGGEMTLQLKGEKFEKRKTKDREEEKKGSNTTNKMNINLGIVQKNTLIAGTIAENTEIKKEDFPDQDIEMNVSVKETKGSATIVEHMKRHNK
ncbi:MAG: hypothetical protein GY757_55770 [bacterium]|nr:hypothetical protein [bacterium]